MHSNPLQDLLERTVVGFQQADDELFALVGGKHKLPPIQTQENVSCEESDSFIAIDKGVIDQQRFEQCRRHFFYMCVVTGLRPKEGAFQESPVADTVVAAKSLDQSFLNCEHFIERKKLN